MPRDVSRTVPLKPDPTVRIWRKSVGIGTTVTANARNPRNGAEDPARWVDAAKACCLKGGGKAEEE